MIPATEGVVRLQMKSKSSMPWTARGCIPLHRPSVYAIGSNLMNHSLYEASCLVVEKGIGEGRPHSAGRLEASDVIIGIGTVGGAEQGGCRHDG